MNILFISYFPTYPIAGGIQRVTTSLAKEFSTRGYSICYLCYKYTNNTTDNSSVPQYFINIKNCSDNTIKTEINSIIEKHNIDIIINQTPNNGSYRICKLIDKNVKIISVIHTQPYSTDNITWKRIWNMRTINFKHFLFKTASLLNVNIYKKFFSKATDKNLKRAFEISDKVCFISERFYSRVLKHLPEIPKEKLASINNPNSYNINGDSFYPIKENLIIWVGRVENSNKNTLDFIKAWKYFYKDHTDWKAAIIGAGEGTDLEYNKKYVRKHNIKNLDFIGRINNVEEWYKRAKIVAVTSWGESWCLAITEGMQYGCIPCAYNTYETLEDIIDNNINGFIIQPTPKTMAECFENIATKIDIEIFSKEAQQKVLKFSIKNIAEQWDILLKSMQENNS